MSSESWIDVADAVGWLKSHNPNSGTQIKAQYTALDERVDGASERRLRVQTETDIEGWKSNRDRAVAHLLEEYDDAVEGGV